jgi:hypothetical protein
MSDLTLDETAVHLHELYSSFKRAGFTPEEALELLKAMIANNKTEG